MSQWTILGCGAVGSLLAGLLWQSAQPVSLLRSDGPRAPREDLSLQRIDGSTLTFNPPRLGQDDAGDIQRLLVTTKAYQVQPALEPLIGKLPVTTPIILLHNGMGTQLWVERAFPENPLFIAITSNGARRLGNGVMHTGNGETWLGAANELARANSSLANQLAADLAQALPHAALSHEIHFRQWEKLVINAIINPLTAISGERNGSLMARGEEIADLCAELHPLLRREGFGQSAEYWLERVLLVASRTAENYSSMQQDVANGRPTEIDYLSGYLLRQARAEGIALPLQQALYQAIKAKEQSR